MPGERLLDPDETADDVQRRLLLPILDLDEQVDPVISFADGVKVHLHVTFLIEVEVCLADRAEAVQGEPLRPRFVGGQRTRDDIGQVGSGEGRRLQTVADLVFRCQSFVPGGLTPGGL